MLQSLDLETKIKLSQEIILDWSKNHKGRVAVSFSGGKDSSVLLDVARKAIPNIDAVFIDTGLEYPEVVDNVKKYENVEVFKPQDNFRDLIIKSGYPLLSKEIAQKLYELKNTNSEKLKNKRLYGDDKGNGKLAKKWWYLIKAPFKIDYKCCYYLKKKPMHDYEVITRNSMIVGTRTEESSLRLQNCLRYGFNTNRAKHNTSRPLSFWTEQDILLYIKTYGVSIPKIYGDIVEENGVLKTTGAVRTGCMFCCFGLHLEKQPNRFQRMKQTHPEQYEYCMKPVEEGGLGLDSVLEYMEIPH